MTESKFTELRNGPFEVETRSQEFNNSGIKNIDVCVADSSEHEFPKSEIQCVLHGYDIVGYSVNWKSNREIDISFDCGTISQFSNYAVVSPKDSLPVQFHVRLFDKCKS